MNTGITLLITNLTRPSDWMNPDHTHRLTPALILAAAVGTACGGQIDTALAPPPSAASLWEFRAEPYGWLPALSGTTGVGPIAAEVDSSVGDVLGNLKMEPSPTIWQSKAS